MQLYFLFFIFSNCKESLPFTAEAQELIHRSQHPANCSNVNWVTIGHVGGIGSEIHVTGAVLSWAINNHAIMMWSNTGWMSHPNCSMHTFECIFLPATNCTLDSLDPKKHIWVGAIDVKYVIPHQFSQIDFSPFTTLYWWRAQSTLYLTRFNERFEREMEEFRKKSTQLTIHCNTICVYVRHGAKASEMELLPWSRFYHSAHVASEISSLWNLPINCRSRNFTVFLMTDDKNVINDAKKDLGERLLFVEDSVNNKLPHKGGEDNPLTRMENVKMSMLNLHYCLKCDGFVSQRAANFARLVDELRITSAGKLNTPFIEAGEYSFSWK
jgi:hypothetical protein